MLKRFEGPMMTLYNLCLILFILWVIYGFEHYYLRAAQIQISSIGFAVYFVVFLVCATYVASTVDKVEEIGVRILPKALLFFVCASCPLLIVWAAKHNFLGFDSWVYTLRIFPFWTWVMVSVALIVESYLDPKQTSVSSTKGGLDESPAA